MMTTQRIGYGRVSTTDQNPDSQEDALTKAGCERRFVEKISGTKASRPQWNACKEALRKGDTLVVTRLDRLGRSTKDLLEIAEFLESKGVNLVATEQENIDTTTPHGKMFFTILAAVAEFEHAMMKARTLDGLAAARARGRKGGRRNALSPKQIDAIRNLYETGDTTVSQIAEAFKVSRPTVYRALERNHELTV